MELKDNMSVEEFQKYCNEKDYNSVENWDNINKFDIVCIKCKSKDVYIKFRPERGCMGSEYTGYMHGFYNDCECIVKCKDCGNTMLISLPDYG